MNIDAIVEKLKLLEYHQKILLKMSRTTSYPFYQLVIEKSMKEEEVAHFYKLCEKMSIELEEQKADGYVHFHPLLLQFTERLHPKMKAKEVISACLAQGLYLPLMTELKKYL